MFPPAPLPCLPRLSCLLGNVRQSKQEQPLELKGSTCQIGEATVGHSTPLWHRRLRQAAAEGPGCHPPLVHRHPVHLIQCTPAPLHQRQRCTHPGWHGPGSAGRGGAHASGAAPRRRGAAAEGPV